MDFSIRLTMLIPSSGRGGSSIEFCRMMRGVAARVPWIGGAQAIGGRGDHLGDPDDHHPSHQHHHHNYLHSHQHPRLNNHHLPTLTTTTTTPTSTTTATTPTSTTTTSTNFRTRPTTTTPAPQQIPQKLPLHHYIILQHQNLTHRAPDVMPRQGHPPQPAQHNEPVPPGVLCMPIFEMSLSQVDMDFSIRLTMLIPSSGRGGSSIEFCRMMRGVAARVPWIGGAQAIGGRGDHLGDPDDHHPSHQHHHHNYLHSHQHPRLNNHHLPHLNNHHHHTHLNNNRHHPHLNNNYFNKLPH
ncbi:hybrid signal transduction histidine kinase G-like [Macrosteles quadrilineatus]|uniref:hybrid signal transduction histidine kinase G-like n=1 Tax=Macrosteles quadrilineatus TaxID=74068 RepID=UPI0023E0C166|nr:hybrid signal transduction histidine kinase G-like [Macrosteles quadrilineatus]